MEFTEMHKTDFEYDYNLFKNHLFKAQYVFQRVTTKIHELAAHWDELGRQFLDGKINTEVSADGRVIDGDVLGKKFRINFAPILKDEKGYMEAAISVPDLVTGEHFEISRFLVSSSGLIFSTEGEDLQDPNDPQVGFQALAAIALRVIQTSSTSNLQRK